MPAHEPPPPRPELAPVHPDTAVTPSSLARHTAALLERLPAAGPYGLRRLTAGWLAGRRSDRTRAAYIADLSPWLDWCAAQGLDPLAVRRVDLDGYRWALEHPTDRPAPSPSTVGRKLSSLSSWYTYLVENDAIGRNPAAAVERPEVDRDTSQTVGMSRPQVRAFLTALADDPLRNRALLTLLVDVGIRVAEATNADVSDYAHTSGYQVIWVTRKGGKRYRRTVPVPVAALVDAYLAERAAQVGCVAADLSGPLFVTTATGRHPGGKRLDRWAVKKVIRRIARRAELPQADQLTPHSLRHTFATLGLDAGASLRDMQDALGHADTRTTRRYDRARNTLARDPALLVAAATTTGDED